MKVIIIDAPNEILAERLRGNSMIPHPLWSNGRVHWVSDMKSGCTNKQERLGNADIIFDFSAPAEERNCQVTTADPTDPKYKKDLDRFIADHLLKFNTHFDTNAVIKTLRTFGYHGHKLQGMVKRLTLEILYYNESEDLLANKIMSCLTNDSINTSFLRGVNKQGRTNRRDTQEQLDILIDATCAPTTRNCRLITFGQPFGQPFFSSPPKEVLKVNLVVEKQQEKPTRAEMEAAFKKFLDSESEKRS